MEELKNTVKKIIGISNKKYCTFKQLIWIKNLIEKTGLKPYKTDGIRNHKLYYDVGEYRIFFNINDRVMTLYKK